MDPLPLIFNLQSCISEAQKYEGSHYREKKGKMVNPPSAPVTPGYRQPSVEDAPDSQTPQDWSVARVEVPPPAPSPPPAGPINVFDFLVQDGQRSSSVSTRSSPAPQIKAAPPRKRVQMADDAITYGNGTVSSSNTKYASDLSLAMEVDQNGHKANTALQRTPAPKHKTEIREPSSKAAKSGSEKKRKRPPVEELDLSESRKSSQELSDSTPAVLHSGLTGGLAKMLADKEAASQQASPLSPKKRSKRDRHDKYEKIETDSADGGRDRHRKKRHDKQDDDDASRHRRHKRHRSDGDDGRKTLEAPPAFKAIEYHKQSNGARSTTSSSRASFRSHSEFFLSLVDKGHTSHKGQSIYGTLKSFHDGIIEDGDQNTYEDNGEKVREERRLLKALRMKINKQGEIVLFARPDFESDGEDLQRRIEAP